MYYDAGKKEVKVFSGVGSAPLDPEAFNGIWKMESQAEGIKTAAVPAVIDLCITVMKEYGG